MWTKLATASLLAVALAGCGGGSDGAPGAAGLPGKDVDPTVVNDLTAKVTALTQAANPETCVTCHTGTAPVAKSGAQHQASYNQYYQDGIVKIVSGSMALVSDGVDTTTLTFKMTKNGAAFDCRKSTAAPADFSIGSYWASYDVATKTFPDDLSLVPTNLVATTAKPNVDGAKNWDAVTNVCTFTKKSTAAADKAIVVKIAAVGATGIVQIYGTDEILSTDSAKHLVGGKYPFAGVLKVGTVDYNSAANVSGCESCHTTPFLKHTYIYGTVADNTTGAPTQFYTCKGCHFDTKVGGHVAWQIEKDDPVRAAAIAGGSAITAAENTKYAYKAKLMNDVHMSHAMEFPYPQSMRNCVTCHKGNLDTALADSKFQAETCISCHSVDGVKVKMTAASYNHSSLVADDAVLKVTNCSACHKDPAAGGFAPTFKKIHSGGYDPKIYTAASVRYSDAIKVTIDSTTIAANTLTIKFSAADTGATGFAMDSIKPTVLVGLYGYNTKDFIVAAHGSQADKTRNLEYAVGATHPRFKTVSAAAGKWEVTADLSLWADKIAAGTIKRAEIAVLPNLSHPTIVDPTSTTTPKAKLVLGLDAPSKTFVLSTGKFEDNFGEIVNVAGTKGCNTCHDQLATTFHAGDRGGNLKVCRICHEVSSPGAHLEMQSRSIDSYVHAIHSFQAFDTNKINFADPTAAYEYKAHIGTDYPKFGITNCESCHKPGTYDVPNQAKSMPGLLSAAYTLTGWVRNIGVVPSYVTGPAVRACGSCHRSQMINADDAGGLAQLNAHFKTFGYTVENETGLWDSIVAKIMTVFK